MSSRRKSRIAYRFKKKQNKVRQYSYVIKDGILAETMLNWNEDKAGVKTSHEVVGFVDRKRR